MKAPNGFGGIRKLKGNRRNPYMAEKTLGYHIVNPDAPPEEQKLKRDYYISVMDVDLRNTFGMLQSLLILLMKDPDTVICLCILFQNLRGLICRTIIHADDLDLPQGLTDHAVQTLPQPWSCIVNRNHDRYHNLF